MIIYIYISIDTVEDITLKMGLMSSMFVLASYKFSDLLVKNA